MPLAARPGAGSLARILLLGKLSHLSLGQIELILTLFVQRACDLERQRQVEQSPKAKGHIGRQNARTCEEDPGP